MQDSTLIHVAAWIARVSCQATLVASAVLFVQWALRDRLSASLRYALWFLLLLRLVLPASLQSRWSLFNLPLGYRTAVAPGLGSTIRGNGSATVAVSPALTEGIGSIDRMPPVASSSLAQLPAFNAPNALATVLPASGAARGHLVLTIPDPHTSGLRLKLLRLFAWAWLAGMTCLGLRLAWQCGRFTRRLRGDRSVNDPGTLALLADCSHRVGLRGPPPPLFESEAVDSPALYGFWRPRLLLPTGMLRDYSATELRFVFLHELGHLKRHDMAVHWLMAALEIVHWFNPVLWFAFRRMRGDRELACDALALSRADAGDVRPYGETILRIVSDLSRPAAVPGLIGMAEGMRQMKTRMSMIARFRSRPRRPITAVLLFGLLAVATLTDAQTKPGQSAPVSDPAAAGSATAVAEAAPTAEDSASLIRDGRLLIELGRLDEAEAKLLQVLRRNPNDREAGYYVSVVKEARLAPPRDPVRLSPDLERLNKPYRPDATPARRGLRRSPGQEVIQRRLNEIVLEQVRYDGVPLSDVVRDLIAQAQARDTDKLGVNIVLNPSPAEAAGTRPDPATSAQQVDPSQSGAPLLKDVLIRLALKRVTLGETIDAICKVAETPIRYTVEDYAIVFVQGVPEPQKLFTRTYRVDPNSFIEGLSSVTTNALAAPGERLDILRGQIGGVGDRGGANGTTAPGDARSGIGVSGISSGVPSSSTIARMRDFFSAAGVDFSEKVITLGATGIPQPSGKALFFNDRTGLLLVRATMEELDTVEKAIQVLNTTPPQLSIAASLIEFEPRPRSQAGFDWFLGILPSSPSGLQQPGNISEAGATPGIFPGSPPGVSAGPVGAKPVANPGLPATGVLSEAQAQTVLRAVEQGGSGRLVASPTVTTLSGRQIRTEIPSAGFSLDVLPQLKADGFSIELIVDFVLNAAAAVPNAPVKSATPLRLSTRAIVWDGQTMVLGPFPTSNAGAERKVLLLIRPTLIDPAGNRVHSGHSGE